MPGQTLLREWDCHHVNDGPLQSTLRETQAHFSSPRTWIAILIVGVLIGLTGPFNTFQYIALLPRLAYWLVLCAACYAIGFFGATGLETWLGPHLRPRWLRLLVTGLLPGIPIAFFVHLTNGLSFGFTENGLIGLVTLLVYCPLIALGITVASALAATPAPIAEITPQTPTLLERLPRPLRGRLLHLAVADHYVDVTTERGHALVLIRLSDAMRETAPVQGLQVHRSHWVALDAVRRSTRQAGKPVLELENGTLVPVSRSFLPAVRAAGLLG